MEALLGSDPVHYAANGFAVMARNIIEMVEGPRSVFQARRREDEWWRMGCRTELTWGAGREATRSGCSPPCRGWGGGGEDGRTG